MAFPSVLMFLRALVFPLSSVGYTEQIHICPRDRSVCLLYNRGLTDFEFMPVSALLPPSEKCDVSSHERISAEKDLYLAHFTGGPVLSGLCWRGKLSRSINPN